MRKSSGRSRLRRRVGLALLAACATLVAARTSLAQSSFELVPFVGSFIPLTSWGTLTEPSANSTGTFRQQLGVLGGLKAHLKVTDAVGLELGGSYVNSGWTEERV